ncbi:MAG: histidine ammonia-lyase [Anaerolineae bacterium]
MVTIELDGEYLTIEDVITVARNPGIRVEISDDARACVARSRVAVEQFVEHGDVIYGITTGFGHFRNQHIDLGQTTALQRNLIRSHAAGVGPHLSQDAVRALMVVRANTLAKGYSGIRPKTLQTLIDMLNQGVHPVIPEQGSLGTSGDLAPLAHMTLVLIGEGEATLAGETLPGGEALNRAGLEPVELAAKEGLALVNGTAFMAGLGALVTHGASNLVHAADIAGALSLEALNGSIDPFDPRIQAARPHPRQIEAAGYIRRLLDGSQFIQDADDPQRTQDAYSLRCIPQVHGAVHDAVAYARWALEIEINSATDNPLIFLENDGPVALSGGNFHGELMAMAMDYLAMGLTELGNISERRMNRLVDADLNDGLLPDFLTEHGGLNSGFMLAHYTAAALTSENKVLAHPACVDTVPTSANTEDHQSMGGTAVRHARDVLKNVETIVALELFAAAQAIDFRRRQTPGEPRLGVGTAPVYDLIRQHVPFIEHDTIMYPHIEAVRRLVADGRVIYAAESAVYDS